MKLQILLFLILFVLTTNIHGQIKLYDLINKIPSREVEFEYEKDTGNIDETLKCFKLYEQENIIVYSILNDSILIKFSSSDKVEQKFASTKLRLVNKEKKKVLDIDFTDSILCLRKKGSLVYVFYENSSLANIHKITELDFISYVPIIDVYLEQFVRSIYPYPNCSPCSGDIKYIYNHNTQQSKKTNSSYYVPQMCYDCFLLVCDQFK